MFLKVLEWILSEREAYEENWLSKKDMQYGSPLFQATKNLFCY